MLTILESKMGLKSLNLSFLHTATNNPPVILLHGLGVTSDYWRPTIPALVSAGFDVSAIDLTGFGKTDLLTRPYTLKFHSSILNEFIEDRQYKEVIIIGHSMGGGIAIEYATDYPKRIRALVLSDALGVNDELLPVSLSFFTELVIPSVFFRIFGQSQKVVELILKKNFYNIENFPSEFKNWIMTDSWMGSFKGLFWTNIGMLLSVGLTSQRQQLLRRFRKTYEEHDYPMLVFWGENDTIIPVSNAHIISNAIPDAELHIFPKCGHVPSLEKVEQFNKILISFLSRL